MSVLRLLSTQGQKYYIFTLVDKMKVRITLVQF